MKRSDFLKSLGALGLGTMLPLNKVKADAGTAGKAVRPAGVDCVLIPQETEGPYPLDLSKDSTKFRQDVFEDHTGGVPLKMVMTVVNINDGCKPIANARVDIWQCDSAGVYSGFSQPGANTVGQTFMRGIQMTDSNGQVEFHTMYPGWYQGRITHIHFQVFLNSVLKATSQAAFPDSLNETVYSDTVNYPKGQNTSIANNAADMVFAEAGDLAHELLSIVPKSSGPGYDATLTVGIAAPVSGIINLEPETGGQFKLQQNFPNPFGNTTAVIFSLTQPSNVQVTIFDMNGREVVKLHDGSMTAGDKKIDWNREVAGVPVAAGNYLYQLTVRNDAGQFTQAKVMTAK